MINLDRHSPLWLPPGSVRSILALAIVGAYIAGQVSSEVALAVVGFYFGARGSEGQPAS